MNGSTAQGFSSGQRALLVIAAGCLIAAIGFGARSSLGLFLEPMTATRGWTRETFGLALAIQNLFWGLGLPIAGIFADKCQAEFFVAIDGSHFPTHDDLDHAPTQTPDIHHPAEARFARYHKVLDVVYRSCRSHSPHSLMFW